MRGKWGRNDPLKKNLKVLESLFNFKSCVLLSVKKSLEKYITIYDEACVVFCTRVYDEGPGVSSK